MVDGQKLDAGKTRIELFPGDALYAISQVLTFGAKKYAARNWELGISWGRVFGALNRHIWSWWQGRGPTNMSFLFGELDEESKMSHLWHAGCCLVFLIAYEMRGQVAYDDRPGKQPTSIVDRNPGPWDRQDGQKNPTPTVREQMDPVDFTPDVDALINKLEGGNR